MISDEGRQGQLGGVVETDTAAGDIPIVVDVDGTLLRTDLLVEAFIRLIMTRPLDAFMLPAWLAGGKANLKRAVADRVSIDTETLPIDNYVADFMRAEAARGRKVFLASASDRRWIEPLSKHLGFIDGVFATDCGVNLSGSHKRDALVRAFGEGGFDYIGNSPVDRHVWDAARQGYAIRSGFSNPANYSKVGGLPVETLLERRYTIKIILKLFRLSHWAKNLLLFVPLILGGTICDTVAITKTCFAFVAFGLLASATYTINDIIDTPSDRRHATKRHRPLANGSLSLSFGIVLAALGLGSGLVISFFLGLPVFLGLFGYVVLTIAYSLRLKRVPIVDVALLGCLYTWRLFVGVLASGVVLSAWLMVFSFAFFLSLSLAKRYTEITRMINEGRSALAGRGYRTIDAAFVMSMGVAAGVSSILIFVLYLTEGAFRRANFSTPEALWACPVILLLWLSRIWMLCGRGELHDDPVEFAITDRKSLILGMISCAAVLIAILGDG
jgi:4-hydroxybenzoate polyprenyltransferase